MALVARDVFKTLGDPPTHVLRGISLKIEEGAFVALTGRSGSGKSTLLYILSSLDSPTSGTVEIHGKNLAAFSSDELHEFRNRELGFVFQFHYLLSELSALENVLMPARKFAMESEKLELAKELLGQFGLGDKIHRLPRQLSGGEQQRVAIARSLVMSPKYLFADEPTGALDTANGELVMRILKQTNEKLGTAVIMVTHDPDFAASAHQIIHLKDGQVVEREV